MSKKWKENILKQPYKKARLSPKEWFIFVAIASMILASFVISRVKVFRIKGKVDFIFESKVENLKKT
jgi:hypothetical protein